MSTITKERVANLLQFNSEGSDCQANAEQWEVHELARIALASLEAEPVGEIVLGEYDDCGCHPDARVACIAADGQADWENFKDGTRLYTAPPAPVSVPDDVSGPLAHAYKELTPTFMRNHIDVFERYGIYPDGSAGIQAMRIALDGMNRRAAMLQGAAENSPVIPDGVCPCCGRKPLKNRACSVSGCDGKHVARGFCAMHYAIERKKDPSRRESIRAADKRYRARKAAAPQQEA
ncbi:DUF551 domain-containing protein [Enterobacter hormaechei]|uniref:DUF551 domain-containing protein n=1 Tax=Enterobacter hormaechei TaxID=158836 RepID=UPI003F21C818|nr:DUF551 domain-containing protein [Enterobacter hormaechei]